MKLPIWDWQILNQTNLPWRPLSIWNLSHTVSSWKLLMLWGPKSIDFNNFQFLWGVSHLKENMKRFLQCIISFFFMKIRKKWILSRYSISISLRNARQPADRGDCLCCLLWRRLFLLLPAVKYGVVVLFAVGFSLHSLQSICYLAINPLFSMRNR